MCVCVFVCVFFLPQQKKKYKQKGLMSSAHFQPMDTCLLWNWKQLTYRHIYYGYQIDNQLAVNV